MADKIASGRQWRAKDRAFVARALLQFVDDMRTYLEPSSVIPEERLQPVIYHGDLKVKDNKGHDFSLDFVHPVLASDSPSDST